MSVSMGHTKLDSGFWSVAGISEENPMDGARSMPGPSEAILAASNSRLAG
jgi:hypothetical protein